MTYWGAFDHLQNRMIECYIIILYMLRVSYFFTYYIPEIGNLY